MQLPQDRLDLLPLGLGEDGHNASLFTSCIALHEGSKVVSVTEPKSPEERIATISMVTHQSEYLVRLASGERPLARSDMSSAI